MLGQSKVYSSYLVQPRIHSDRTAQWNGFRTQFFEIKRSNPHLIRNTLGILAVWVAVIASVQTITAPAPASGRLASLSSYAAPLPGSAAPAGTTAPAAKTAAAQAAPAAPAPTTLANGPTGQLMPTGSMAPFGTFRNTYAWGQCTWYVANRREIPANWGNANTWYYHAISSGWKVGTTPAVAAVAWTGAGYYGHVALVEQVSADGRQVLVSEMNYRGVGIRSSRWASSSSFRYIY